MANGFDKKLEIWLSYLKTSKLYNFLVRLDISASSYVLLFMLVLVTFVSWYGCNDSFIPRSEITEKNILEYKYLYYFFMAIVFPFFCAYAAGAVMAYYNVIPDKLGSNKTAYRYISRAFLTLAHIMTALEWQLCLMNVSVSIVPYCYFMVMIASMSFHIASIRKAP